MKRKLIPFTDENGQELHVGDKVRSYGHRDNRNSPFGHEHWSSAIYGEIIEKTSYFIFTTDGEEFPLEKRIGVTSLQDYISPPEISTAKVYEAIELELIGDASANVNNLGIFSTLENAKNACVAEYKNGKQELIWHSIIKGYSTASMFDRKYQIIVRSID